MKKLIIVLALALTAAHLYAADMVLPITSIVDGDTIKTQLSLPCPLCTVSIRIRDIDTPETTYLAKCTKEKALGVLATNYVKELVGTHEIMTLKDAKWDKYGGRIDAHVFVAGTNIGEALVQKGLAKPYTGEGSKPNWCN
jgi:endonuclease YncB( thermonuclease family)